MKVLILARSKSGTTALLYKLAAAQPELKTFSGGALDKAVNIDGDAVIKFTLSGQKGRSFEDFRDHLSKTEYDRKIWIARDPRDNSISRLLFSWYRGFRVNKIQYRTFINLIEKKEQNPESVPFSELMRYRSEPLEPVSISKVIDDERRSCDQMYRFVNELKDDWFIFKYEDLVEGNFSELNNYLGFEVKAEDNIDKYTQKVARKKSTGDWRHWYTEEDIKLFRSVYTPYMNLIGYDSSDWVLPATQLIEPEYASLYLKSLPHRRRIDSIEKWKKKITRFLK